MKYLKKKKIKEIKETMPIPVSPDLRLKQAVTGIFGGGDRNVLNITVVMF